MRYRIRNPGWRQARGGKINSRMDIKWRLNCISQSAFHLKRVPSCMLCRFAVPVSLFINWASQDFGQLKLILYLQSLHNYYYLDFRKDDVRARRIEFLDGKLKFQRHSLSSVYGRLKSGTLHPCHIFFLSVLCLSSFITTRRRYSIWGRHSYWCDGNLVTHVWGRMLQRRYC